MVSPISLIAIAAVFATLASFAAWARGLTAKDAGADALFALAASLGGMILALVLFARSAVPGSSPFWHEWGSIAMLASPGAAALALRLRGRRSILRALFLSVVALMAVIGWLTLHLKGVRGGWTALEMAVVTGSAAAAVGAAACLGWWSKRLEASRTNVSGVALFVVFLSGCGNPEVVPGTVELTIRDTSSGRPTSARVELTAEGGRSVIPDDALQVSADCGSAPVHNWVPFAAQLQVLQNRHREVENPYTGTRQFYADGSFVTQLSPGRYVVTATKGIEYKIARAELVVTSGQTQRQRLDLVRWINLPENGWYGADDHLHIPRPHPRFDPLIATWMQAEDLHVANLLQMGLARDVHITPQHGFGERSIYQRANTLVVGGQENPRTHVLGHSIILGARQWIDYPHVYLLYDRFWHQAHEQGAVNGYAHWGLAGAEEGLAVWGHRGLLDFIEVLSLGFPFYQRWYEALNLGIQLAPTAGTDYPCLPGLPGRERFYTRLDGPLEFEAWLEAVRRGRTFVTNGPAIDLTVEGARVGEPVHLPAPGQVHIVGIVRFDPDRDDVSRLDLIQAGDVVLHAEEPFAEGEVRIDTTVRVRQSTWFALRALGRKRGETTLEVRRHLESMLVLNRRTNEGLLRSLPIGPVRRPSAAHTAAIWVTVDGTPPVAEQPKARAVMEAWLDRLDQLRERFQDDRLRELAGFPGRGDGIGEAELQANRDLLVGAIEAARGRYTGPATR